MTVGIVEVFEPNRIRGWVSVPADAPPVRVTLHYGNFEIAWTYATAAEQVDRNGPEQIRPFAFRLRDIWAYMRRTNKLSVRVDGNPLPIAGHGMYRSPDQDGRRRFAELRDKLQGGYLFSQWGKLQLPKTADVEWRQRVFDLYDQVRAVLASDFGHDAFLIYGTLLGYVREGGFIGHDIDFDCAYVSDETDPVAAAVELQRLALELTARGYNAELNGVSVHIHHREDPRQRIDVFHLYFDERHRLAFPFGIAGTSVITRDDWQGLAKVDFAGHPVLVPRDAEALVEHIYGASWRQPKPGFDWSNDRTTAAYESRVPLPLLIAAYWTNYYTHAERQEPSTFFGYVSDRHELPSAIVDIGCGDGRDALGFAAAGRPVIGLDQCATAIDRARSSADSDGVRASFATCDVGDRAAVRAALDSRGSEPVLFYLRFLLHAIPEDAQDALLDVLADRARPGDMLAAEFRTAEDSKRPKAHRKHWRRYQDGAAIGALLVERYGWTILDSQHGTGLAPLGREDPYLYRVIARR